MGSKYISHWRGHRPPGRQTGTHFKSSWTPEGIFLPSFLCMGEWEILNPAKFQPFHFLEEHLYASIWTKFKISTANHSWDIQLGTEFRDFMAPRKNANCSLIVAPMPVPCGTANYAQVTRHVAIMGHGQLFLNSWCNMAIIKRQWVFPDVLTIAAAIRQFLPVSPAMVASKSHFTDSHNISHNHIIVFVKD